MRTPIIMPISASVLRWLPPLEPLSVLVNGADVGVTGVDVRVDCSEFAVADCDSLLEADYSSYLS